MLPYGSQITRRGYIFDGWYTNSSLSGTRQYSISENARGNKKFYAKWKPALYNVKLNPNGGTIAEGHNITQYTAGVGANLPNSSTITKHGYTFKGWYANSSLTGSSYTKISASESGNKEYWAKWTPTVYDVNLVTNGGTINSGNVTSYTYGVGATLPSASQVYKRGHMFLGWYTTSTFMGASVSAIGSTETGNKTFYAKWQPIVYDVKLHTNGGTIASGYNVTKYTYGVGANLPTVANITKRGHTFKGWYDNSSFSGSPVTKIGTTEIGNKEYWAKWTPNVYEINLVTNGGTINSGNVTSYTYGVGATLPTDITKRGHNFLGWYNNSSFSGSPVTKVGTDEIGNKTFYAKWEPCIYDVILHPNGGTIDPSVNVTSYTYGVGAKLPTGSEVLKPSEEFGGWYDNSSLTGTPVTNITTTDLGRKEYWAKWITFDVVRGNDKEVNIYAVNDDKNVYKVDKLKYRVNTVSSSKLEAYFTKTESPTSDLLSRPELISKNTNITTDIPSSVVRDVLDVGQIRYIYLQIRVTATDTAGKQYYIYVTNKIKIRYCVAFKEY